MVDTDVIKLENGRYAKHCLSCGAQQTYLRKNYAIESLRLKKLCKGCSNKITDNCHRGWYRAIRVSWYNKFKSGALLRGLEWDITLDDIADVMEAQNGKCALTGWDIEFPEAGHPQKAPASIDRIDSSKGYILDNVQLLTRHVNMMKQSYDNDYFIEVCKAVADKVKW
jgi:hypothetical protein